MTAAIDLPVRAVLFDAGLTLIRAASSSADVAGPVLASQGVSFDTSSLEAVMAEAEAQLEARWTQGDWFVSEAGVRRLFVDLYREALGRLPSLAGNPARIPALAGAIYDDYLDTRHWTAYPDVLPTLSALREAGLTMGVVSDWGHGLEALLLELELGDFFSFLVVSSRLGVTKPDPHVFDMALRRIDVDAAHAVYVGDTYVKDVLGARAAGITPVLLDRPGTAPRLDCAVVRSLTGLLPMVGLPAL